MPIADIGGKVLITRSEPGASELAAALCDVGYAAVVCPLLEIRPIEDPSLRRTVAGLDRFDVAIFVSGHAVRFGLDLIDAVWPNRPRLIWIAVGEATAMALARRGITALAPESESSEGILALPQLSQIVGRRVLICSGGEGRALLADELSRRGALVERLELYRRESVPIAEVAKNLAGTGPVAAVVVASVEGARAFASAWRGVSGDRGVTVIAPSQRVATELKDLNFRRVIVANGAGAKAVVEALAQATRARTGKHDE